MWRRSVIKALLLKDFLAIERAKEAGGSNANHINCIPFSIFPGWSRYKQIQWVYYWIWSRQVNLLNMSYMSSCVWFVSTMWHKNQRQRDKKPVQAIPTRWKKLCTWRYKLQRSLRSKAWENFMRALQYVKRTERADTAIKSFKLWIWRLQDND